MNTRALRKDKEEYALNLVRGFHFGVYPLESVTEALSMLREAGPDAVASHVDIIVPLTQPLVRAHSTEKGWDETEESMVREAALETLGVLPPALLAQQVPVILPLFHEEDDDVRHAARETLSKLGPALAQHADAIEPLLKHDNRFARISALRTLEAGGATVVASHLDAILPLLEDNEPKVGWMVREAARDTLRTLPPALRRDVRGRHT